MESFRILVLVLASDSHSDFEAVWKQVSHPRADLLFVKADPTLSEDRLDGDTIRIACEDTIPFIYEKQMRAFRLLRPRLSQYAYVLRTNLSSFIDLPRYLAFCEGIPRTGAYSGVIGDHGGIRFASGSGFTLTPDLIERLLDESPPKIVEDDVSIGAALTAWGIPILPAPRIDHLYADDRVGLHESPLSCLAFHRRFKSDDRVRDVERLQSYVRSAYPKV